jgi:DNA polymerase-3 subunit epsilon
LQLRPDLSQDRDRLKINLNRESPGMASAGEIVAFDVETTGLSPQRGHRVIEIGAVRIVNGAFTEEFDSLIDCRGSISMSAQRIHGITPTMLRGQPPPAVAFAAFRDFIGQAPLAAHNARFDMSFLRHEFSRLGWPLPNRSLCTLEACRRRLIRLPDYRLETIAAAYSDCRPLIVASIVLWMMHAWWRGCWWRWSM